MTQVGELYVEVDAKGVKKSTRGILDFNKSLLSAGKKAGVLGLAVAAAGYALKKVLTNNEATALNTFAVSTGLSTKKLQQFAYAGSRFGITMQEVAGQVGSLQASFQEMLTTKGIPGFLGIISKKIGFKFDSKSLKNTFLMIDKFREYAKAEKDIAKGNQVLKMAGLDPKTIAFFRSGDADFSKLSNNPFLSKSSINSLARTNKLWTDLGRNMKLASNSFSASHGLAITQSILSITKSMLKLAEALGRVLEYFKFFQQLTSMLETISDTASFLTGGGTKKKNKEVSQSIVQTALTGGGSLDLIVLNLLKKLFVQSSKSGDNSVSNSSSKSESKSSINVNQKNNIYLTDKNLNVGSVDDINKGVGDETKKAVQEAYNINLLDKFRSAL